MNIPNEAIAATVVEAMTNQKVLSTERMTTGDQYFVFAAKSAKSEYVIRMTTSDHKQKFISALYWQEKLLPIGVPLAKFIQTDLDSKYSPFPALLMMRLPGDDLCNVYSTLTAEDKRNLAKEMIKIQAATTQLPLGKGFGIAATYEQSECNSWYEFIINRLEFIKGIIKENAIFDSNKVILAISIAKAMEQELRTIPPTPFLWDASERNVIIHQGNISGIVDVDDLCFGDPLFVIALTAVALENEGHDTLYTDYWAGYLMLDKFAQLRLEFYRLFYIVVFMRKHAMTTANNQKVVFNVQRLNGMFQQSLKRIEA